MLSILFSVLSVFGQPSYAQNGFHCGSEAITYAVFENDQSTRPIGFRCFLGTTRPGRFNQHPQPRITELTEITWYGETQEADGILREMGFVHAFEPVPGLNRPVYRGTISYITGNGEANRPETPVTLLFNAPWIFQNPAPQFQLEGSSRVFRMVPRILDQAPSFLGWKTCGPQFMEFWANDATPEDGIVCVSPGLKSFLIVNPKTLPMAWFRLGFGPFDGGWFTRATDLCFFRDQGCQTWVWGAYQARLENRALWLTGYMADKFVPPYFREGKEQFRCAPNMELWGRFLGNSQRITGYRCSIQASPNGMTWAGTNANPAPGSREIGRMTFQSFGFGQLEPVTGHFKSVTGNGEFPLSERTGVSFSTHAITDLKSVTRMTEDGTGIIWRRLTSWDMQEILGIEAALSPIRHCGNQLWEMHLEGNASHTRCVWFDEATQDVAAWIGAGDWGAPYEHLGVAHMRGATRPLWSSGDFCKTGQYCGSSDFGELNLEYGLDAIGPRERIFVNGAWNETWVR